MVTGAIVEVLDPEFIVEDIRIASHHPGETYSTLA